MPRVFSSKGLCFLCSYLLAILNVVKDLLEEALIMRFFASPKNHTDYINV